LRCAAGRDVFHGFSPVIPQRLARSL